MMILQKFSMNVFHEKKNQTLFQSKLCMTLHNTVKGKLERGLDKMNAKNGCIFIHMHHHYQNAFSTSICYEKVSSRLTRISKFILLNHLRTTRKGYIKQNFRINVIIYFIGKTQNSMDWITKFVLTIC